MILAQRIDFGLNLGRALFDLGNFVVPAFILSLKYSAVENATQSWATEEVEVVHYLTIWITLCENVCSSGVSVDDAGFRKRKG